jgi:hypothetical protein
MVEYHCDCVIDKMDQHSQPDRLTPEKQITQYNPKEKSWKKRKKLEMHGTEQKSSY